MFQPKKTRGRGTPGGSARSHAVRRLSMAGPGGNVRAMSPQETAQWCNSLALCGVKGRILRDLQEQIQRRQIDGLQFDQMLRTNTLTDLGIEDLNARLALSIRRSWTTDFNGVTFVNYTASQAHFQGRDEDPRRQKRDFFSQADGLEPEHPRASYGGMPPSRGRDMPWSPSMAHGGGIDRMVGRDPRLEDPYSAVDQRVPPPYPGDRGMGYDDFYDRGMGQMPADRRAAWRGAPPRLEGLDPWGRGPQIQIPPSPPGARDGYGGYDPGYDPGYDDYDRVPGPGHRDDPGRGFGYPDRGPAFSPEDERHERAIRRSPGGGDAWSGLGLDQALPKRGPVPNNVARMYDGPPGPAWKAQQTRSPQGPRVYEEHDYEPPQPAVPSKGGRANVRDPNAGEWGGLFGEEPAAPPPKRPQRREVPEYPEPEEAGSLLLAVPAGRREWQDVEMRRILKISGCASPELRALQAASTGSDHYQLPQEHKEHTGAFAALLSDPRQRNVVARLRLLVERPWLLLRAAEDIQAGEELMDSYFFPLVPLEERHSRKPSYQPWLACHQVSTLQASVALTSWSKGAGKVLPTRLTRLVSCICRLQRFQDR
eukprot:s856_g4.t2